MSVLGPIATSEGVYNSDDLSALFKVSIDKCRVYQVGHERIGSDKYMCTRNQYWMKALNELTKEFINLRVMAFRQNRKPRNRLSFLTIVAPGQSPNPPTTVAAFFLIAPASTRQDRMEGR